MSLLIGFGYQAQMGKDTAVNHIVAHRSDKLTVKRYALADILKVEAYDALNNRLDPLWAFLDTLTPAHGLYYDSVALPKPFAFASPLSDEAKMAWINENKAALRLLLQIYGTEYRRKADPFYWVRALGLKINAEGPQVALISDMRMLNETYFIKANDGFTVRVHREDFDNGVSNHTSEQQLSRFEFDYTISVGEGQIEQLKQDALEVFDDIIDRCTPEEMETKDFNEESFGVQA